MGIKQVTAIVKTCDDNYGRTLVLDSNNKEIVRFEIDLWSDDDYFEIEKRLFAYIEEAFVINIIYF